MTKTPEQEFRYLIDMLGASTLEDKTRIASILERIREIAG